MRVVIPHLHLQPIQSNSSHFAGVRGVTYGLLPAPANVANGANVENQSKTQIDHLD